jgi:hypothetical protein
MVKVLPPQLLQGATLRANEYGWSVAAFPDALAGAEGRGYACLGVSFNFAWMRAALVRCTGSTPTQRTAHTVNRGQTIVIVPVRRFETGFSVWLTRQISASRRRVGGYQ